ncbi:MAG: hypothetical protein WBQ60_00800 [Asticcacaulis sp.]
MKRIIFITFAMLALVTMWLLAGPNLHKFTDTERDGYYDMTSISAAMSHDLLVLAKYQPTDGASHAGQVRRLIAPRI